MVVKNVKTGELTTYEADEKDGMFGVFGFVGRIPNSELFKNTGLVMDEHGYIPTDDNRKARHTQCLAFYMHYNNWRE